MPAPLDHRSPAFFDYAVQADGVAYKFRIADSARLIVVAFPCMSARRLCAYVCRMVACCCGGFPSLAEDPPALVCGGGLSADLAVCRPGRRPSWRPGMLVLRPAGRQR
jgi:hypothetical protein